MLNNEKLDRSYQTSVDVIREVGKTITNDARLRKLSLELLNMAYQNQFEEDRRKIRSQIDEIVNQSISGPEKA